MLARARRCAPPRACWTDREALGFEEIVLYDRDRPTCHMFSWNETIDHPLCPPTTGFVRAAVRRQGLVCVQREGRTKVTWIVNVDLKLGSLASSINSYVLRDGMMRYSASLVEPLEEEAKKERHSFAIYQESNRVLRVDGDTKGRGTAAGTTPWEGSGISEKADLGDLGNLGTLDEKELEKQVESLQAELHGKVEALEAELGGR